MTTTRKPISPKPSMTASELTEALKRALQARAECQGVSVTKLSLLEEASGLANWDAEFSAAPGADMSAECKRATISAKHGVQKRFNLAGSPPKS